jgi:hypothetical protein
MRRDEPLLNCQNPYFDFNLEYRIFLTIEAYQATLEKIILYELLRASEGELDPKIGVASFLL